MPLSAVIDANTDSSRHGQLIRTQALVTYSDPEWHVLFVSDKGLGMFIQPPTDLDVRSGDLVEIEGRTASTAVGFDNPRFTILSRDNPLPSPVKVSGRTSLNEGLSRWVEVSGILRWVSPSGKGVAIQLGCGDRDCLVHLYRGTVGELPAAGSRIRVAGVLAAQLDTQGKISATQIFCPSMQQVKLLSVGPEDAFSLPVTKQTEISKIVPGTMVHVVGQLQNRPDGPVIDLGKESLPIVAVEPMRAVAYKAEAVGFWNGTTIEDVIVRPASKELAQEAEIRNISELKALTPTQAATKRRVALRAVVTYSDPAWGLLFVQDDTGAAFVDVHGLTVRVKSGDVVDITGVSSAGDFAPSITQPSVTFVRPGQLPAPVKIGRSEGNFAKLDSRWTSLQGIVRSVHKQIDHTMLKIGSGRTNIIVELPMAIDGERFVDRSVSVTGAFGILFNDRKQAIGHQIFVPSPDFIQILPNEGPTGSIRAIESLRKYAPDFDEQHSVVLSGIVVLRNSPQVLYLQDQTGGIQVTGADTLQATNGDFVSVRGFVVPGDYSPLLEDAVVTKRQRGPLPDPPQVTAETAATGAYDFQFIRIQGVVNDIRHSSSGTTLGLVSNGLRFEAMGPNISKLDYLRLGSQLEIRGVCQVVVDRAPLTVRGFSILFDSPASVTVLKAGPWWTAEKIGWLLLFILTVAVGVISWAVVLRRKVRSRTQELQDSLQILRNAQQFDIARNTVLETIAANQPLQLSMERLATAVQQQIKDAVCLIYVESQVSADGSTPAPMLVAPGLPGSAQQPILSILKKEFPASGEQRQVREPASPMVQILEAAAYSNRAFSTGQVEFVFRGSGLMAGLIMVLFEKSRAPELAPFEKNVLLSAANLVSIAHEHSDLYQRLLHDAYHDPLTQLPNRTLAEDRLEHALALSERLNRQFTVLCIDLDDFKAINDKLGHAVGDEVLRIVSSRFRTRIRRSDTIARVGGDEFMAILEECTDTSAALTVAQSLVSALQEPLIIDGSNVTLAASIGIASYPADGDTVTALKRHADNAMYSAKGAGGNQIRFWSTEGEAGKDHETENLLRRALDEHLFELKYQPIFDMSGNIVALEALLRLRASENQLLSPSEFIEVAEESGLIVPIGQWALRESCQRFAGWQCQYRGLKLAVNVSARHFSTTGFASFVAEVLAESGIDPTLLEIELTETVIMKDVTESTQQMKRLKQLGCSVAIDDFGTGYSSLNYLHTLPIDILKIDRAFSRTIMQPGGSRVILDAIVTMARTFGIVTVAEGIETDQQLRAVKDAGCDRVQGFLLASPSTAEEVVQILQKEFAHA